MKHFLVCSVLLTTFSCSQVDESLRNDRLIRNAFSKSEIDDLERMLTFFETQICCAQDISSTSILECYKAFFARMDKDEELGIYNIDIPFDNQRSLYGQISDSTFNDLWKFGRTWKVDAPDTMKYMTFNFDGAYFKFLQSFGQENKHIMDYYDACKISGSISPSQSAKILKMSDLYDISDVKIRLFIAIHYLTLNDQYERLEKY